MSTLPEGADLSLYQQPGHVSLGSSQFLSRSYAGRSPATRFRTDPPLGYNQTPTSSKSLTVNALDLDILISIQRLAHRERKLRQPSMALCASPRAG